MYKVAAPYASLRNFDAQVEVQLQKPGASGETHHRSYTALPTIQILSNFEQALLILTTISMDYIKKIQSTESDLEKGYPWKEEKSASRYLIYTLLARYADITKSTSIYISGTAF